MVTMKMADKDVIDLPESDPALTELHLRPFTTVDQKQTLMCIEHMSGWISF
jgi:hypothetical protein